MKPWLIRFWKEHFEGLPECVTSAPGRVNLIGEHTDYNEGFVLPVAINLRTFVALRRASGFSRLVSRELGETPPFVIDGTAEEDGETHEESLRKGWVRYAVACGRALREFTQSPLPPVEGVVASEVPLGAGLSSSAALEVALLRAWSDWLNPPPEGPPLAEIAWRAENVYVGVRCGKMDQLVTALGVEGSALFIDMRSLKIQPVPLPLNSLLVVLDTGVPRTLASSAYNQRVMECRRVVSFFQERGAQVSSLRDVTRDMLELARQGGLDEVAYRRARHVIGENERVLAFKEALLQSEWEKVKELCRCSHWSLRDDYEVSCAELDALEEVCWEAPGCLGARMTGAGFGGACIALVWESQVEDFCSYVSTLYERKGFSNLKIWITRPDSGVRLEQVPLVS